MKPTTPAVVLLALLGLPACGAEKADQVQETQETTSIPVDTLEDDLLLLDPINEPLPVMLEPVDLSGVEGRATTIQTGDSVQVSLMVQGLPRAGDYAAHIHEGTCESGGAVVATLSPVRAAEDGMGRSLTTIPFARLLPEHRYFLQVHGASGAIACGDVHAGGTG
jgi:hypothetical protein